MSISWHAVGDYTDIRYELGEQETAGIAKITIDRPEVRNAFRPETVIELSHAFERAREDQTVGVVILTGEGPDAFCSGGDQRVRGQRGGYVTGADPAHAGAQPGVGRFHVTDLHLQIRRLPKPVVAMVAGYAVGGGHVLHVVCDLTLAADNARFGQTGPKVGSFDGGFGASVLSRLVGPKKAKEIWFLCRQYDAHEALQMGLVNAVVPLDELESRDRQVVSRDAGAVAVRAPAAEGELQRRRGWPGRDPAAGPRREPAVLHERRGAGGPQRLPGEAPGRLLEVPTAAVAVAQTAAAAPSGVRIWLMAARPRTLPAAVAPVLVGTALAGFENVFHPLRFIAALLGAVFIQVGTNLSNDYSDARRGADAEDRLGPVRVTAGGLVPPKQVLVATYVSFGLAVLFGAYLVAVAGWQLLLVGAASILAGVAYTGGPRPYGYEGLGEVFVFLFFGVVAVAGSYFVQVTHLEWEAFALSVPVGLLAAGILVVNNIRDIDSDRRAGKRTLAVRLGRRRTRVLYAVIVYLAFLLAPVTWIFGPLQAWVLLPWLTILLAAGVVRTVRNHTDGQSLNQALAQTGMLQLAFCMLLSAGLLLSG